MKMRFLCLQHRHWLSTDYAAAMLSWFQCYKQGLKLELGLGNPSGRPANIQERAFSSSIWYTP